MKDDTFNDSEKLEWQAPEIQVIPFKNTSGGGPNVPPEDDTYNLEAS